MNNILKDSLRRSREISRADITPGKNFLRDKGRQFYISKIEIRKGRVNVAGRTEKKWFYTQKVTAHPEDPAALMKLYSLGTFPTFDGATFEEKERFSKKIISIVFDLGSLAPEEIESFLRKNNSIFLGDGVAQIWVPYKKIWKQEVIFLNGDARNALGSEATSYTLISAVPSQMRKLTATYCDTDILPSYEAAIEELSGGTASNLLHREVEIKDVVKYVAKFFLLMVPGIRDSFSLEEYGCDIFLGKFGGDQERCDGAAKVSDAVISDKLNIGRVQARSLFLQMRNFKTSKVAAVCESATQMLEFEKLCAAQYGIVFVNKFEDITPDMYGKLVHVGVRNRVDFMSDLNGFKNVPKTSEASDGFMVLDMGKHSKGATNVQFLQFSQHVTGFQDALYAIAKESIIRKIQNILMPRDFISGIDIDPDNIYAANLITQVSPLVFTQSYIRDSVEKAIVKSMNNTIHKMHFPVESLYLRGTSGPEFWLCKHQFLQEGEIFVNDKTLWGKDVCVCRNPRSAGVETYCARIASLEELVQRIYSESNITAAEKEYYRIWYSSISKNVLVTTGSSDFKDKTGGADFDFDGFAVILDEKVCALLKANPNFRVGIVKDKAGAYKVKCDRIQELVTEGFIRTLTTGNSSVSEVAIENSKVQSLLNYIPGEKSPTLAKIQLSIKRDINAQLELPEGKATYVRKYTEACDIAEKDVLQARKEFALSQYSPEGFNDYLRDVTIQYVSIIGRIIDSAKSGEAVTDPLSSALKSVKQMFRNTNPKTGKPFAYIAWDKEKKIFVPSIVKDSYMYVRETKDGEQVVTYYLNDAIYETQKRIVRWACHLLNALRGKADITANVKQHRAASTLECLPCLKQLDLAASDLNHIRKVSDINSKAVGKKAIAVCDPYIADMARLYMDMNKVAPKDRFVSALAVKDIDAAGSFAYNFLKPEAIRYAMSLENAVTTIKERVLPARNNVETGKYKFTEGRCDEFICTSFKFTGTFTVEEQGNEYFFLVNLKELIKYPEPTGKLLFRGIKITQPVIDNINRLRRTKDVVWKVHTYYTDGQSDSLWAQVPGQAPERVCDILLAKTPYVAKLTVFDIKLDDVIVGVLEKKQVLTTTILASIIY